MFELFKMTNFELEQSLQISDCYDKHLNLYDLIAWLVHF